MKNYTRYNQAKIAIAKGGFWGVGPETAGQEFFTAQLQRFYLCDHFGRVTACWRRSNFIHIPSFFVALYQDYRNARMLWCIPGLGLSLHWWSMAIATYGCNVNLFPNTGVTLPLVRHGVRAFCLTCLSIGIILSVPETWNSRKEKQTPGPPDPLRWKLNEV